jgi:hypothetical protein
MDSSEISILCPAFAVDHNWLELGAELLVEGNEAIGFGNRGATRHQEVIKTVADVVRQQLDRFAGDGAINLIGDVLANRVEVDLLEVVVALCLGQAVVEYDSTVQALLVETKGRGSKVDRGFGPEGLPDAAPRDCRDVMRLVEYHMAKMRGKSRQFVISQLCQGSWRCNGDVGRLNRSSVHRSIMTIDAMYDRRQNVVRDGTDGAQPLQTGQPVPDLSAQGIGRHDDQGALEPACDDDREDGVGLARTSGHHDGRSHVGFGV